MRTHYMLIGAVGLFIGLIVVILQFDADLMNDLDGMFLALVVVVCLDVVVGIVASTLKSSGKCKDGAFSWDILAKGILHKLLILSIALVAYMIDMATGTKIIKDAVVLFYLAEESLSILENCDAVGIPIPKRLRKVIESLKEEIEKDDDDDDDK